MKKLLLVAILLLTAVNSFSQVNTIYGPENQGAHFKIIITGDGFTSAQQTAFNTRAQDIVDVIKDTEPYKSNLTKINFYRANRNSVQSGVSVEGCTGTTAVSKNTYWKVHTNDDCSVYAHGISDTKRNLLETEFGDLSNGNRVYVIVISNHTGYGGVGEFKSHASPTDGSLDDVAKVGMVIVSQYNLYNYEDFLPLHEFSHSFGELADEYFGEGPNGEDTTYNRLNSTTRGQHLLSITQTKLNVRAVIQDVNGWYLGGNYRSTIWYRPSDNGMMRGNWNGSGVPVTYSQHNEDLIQDRIDAEAISKIFKLKRIAATSGFSPATSCGYFDYVDRYHDGVLLSPMIGDYIYETRYGKPFDGNNKWWYVGHGKSYQISPAGKLIAIDGCFGIPK